MEDILKQVVGKISSYNIFNNLYPGVLFCYLLKVMFNTNMLTDNWLENLVVFYFVGMVLSRVGSVVIKPLLENVKFRKRTFIKNAPYSDYVSASAEDPLVPVLSETNNTYRTLLSCFVCALIYKIWLIINGKLIQINWTFFQDNKDWFILFFLILLFAFSYRKQSKYVKIRVESVIGKNEQKKDLK